MAKKEQAQEQPVDPKLDPDYLTPEREAVADRLAEKATPIRVDLAAAL